MRLLIFSWVVGLSSVLSLQAQTTVRTNVAAKPITLEESIELALRYNLDVQLARVNINIAQYNVSVAYADWEPFFSANASHNFSSNPSGFDAQGRPIPSTRSDTDSVGAGLGGGGVGASGLLPTGLAYSLSGNASDTVFHRPGFDTNNNVFDTRTETSRGSISLTLRQPILKNSWIDTTRYNIKLSKNRLKSTELSLQFQIMTVVNNVAQAYYELIYARESIQVQQAALELAERLVSENKKKVQIGTMAPLDEKSAESQAAASRADLLKAQNDFATKENVLKSLITATYTALHSSELVPTETMAAPAPVLNLQDSWAKGMAQRPDLLQARLDLERQNIVLRYNYNQLFPELDLIGSYGFTGVGQEFSTAFGGIRNGSDPNYSFGASVTIPLGNRAARGTYAASKEQKKGLLLTLKSLEQGILIQIDNAVKQVQNAYERVDATRQARAYAETALDAEQKKLESGKSTSYLVLQSQRDLTTSRSAEIRALADFNEALSLLYFLEGSILEKNHLGMEVK